MTYHFGRVLHTVTVHAIYWVPAGYSMSPSYKSLVDGYLTNVAADSGKTSNVYASDTQYTDTTTGNILYNFTFAGGVIDTHPFPTDATDATRDACPSFGQACVTDNELIAELHRLVGDVSGFSDLYVILTPRNVDVCYGSFNEGTLGCSADSFLAPAFCAYHSWDGSSDSPSLLYAVQPYFQIGDLGCDPGSQPNGDDADLAINTLSHETNEAITDPTGMGWYQGEFNENGDKCAWNFGAHLGATADGDYNQVIGTGKYFLQREWSNALNGCYQVGPPTVSLDATSGAPGTSVGITGTNFFAPSGTTPVVKFNGIVSPSVTVNSPTHLTVQVPSGNVAGHVTVQAVGGTATSTQFFGQPTINNFSPSSAHAGAVVTINGAGFFGVSSVKFNGVPATFSNVAADGTSLRAVVPLAATDGPISVTGSGGTSGGSDRFTVLPTITSFTPTSGPAGTSVTISGSGFGSLVQAVFTGDGDAPGTVTSHSATQVVVQVPTNASVGVLLILTSDGSAVSTGSFKPLLSVSDLSRSSVKPGDTVTVSGANFKADGPVSVTVSGVTACSPCSGTSTSITFTVPNTVSGAVTVSNADGSATEPISVLPRIDSMAVNGSVVTLRGAGFAGTTSVAFGDGTEPARFTVGATGTTIQATVPASAQTGHIAVTNAGGTTSTSGLFTVAPTITSFAPTSAPVGATIGISGSGLTGADRVDFTGGVSATPTSVTNTSLQVVVPAGAQTGPISVHTSSGSASSSRPLTISFSVARFAPNHADYGATITITGSGLTGTTSVLFNGVPGTNVTVVDDGHVRVTVPASGSLNGQITVVNGGVSVKAPGLFTLFGLDSVSPSAGPAGTTIVITGVGLSAVTRVTFTGGVSGTFTVNSDTQITVVVPAGAQNGSVTVSIAGASASLQYDVT